MTSANLSQSKFRWRQDGGAVDGTPTWGAAITTNWTQPVETNFRIRFLIQNLASGASSATTVKLQVNKNAGTFQDVTTSSTIAKAVTYSTNADNTAIATNVLAGTGTYAQGRLSLTGAPAGSVTVAASGNTEFEFCCRLNAADVANGDTLIFKVVTVSGSTITATTSPSVTVSNVASDTKEWWDDWKDVPIKPAVTAAAAQLLLAAAHTLLPLSSPITSTMAQASSGPLVISQSVVYDATAGVAQPPPVASTTIYGPWLSHDGLVRSKKLQDTSIAATVSPPAAAASITSTMAAAFSGQTTLVQNIVYDSSTGPVKPPTAVAATPTVPQVNSETGPTRSRKFVVPLSSFAFAIPVDDFAFIASDRPVQLPGIRRAAIDSLAQAPQPVAANALISSTVAAAYSGQVSLWNTLVYDASAAPVRSPAVVATPTVLNDGVAPRLRRIIVEPGFAFVDSTIRATQSPIFVSQWHHQWDWRMLAKPQPVDASFAQAPQVIASSAITSTIAAAYSGQTTLWNGIVYDITVDPPGVFQGVTPTTPTVGQTYGGLGYPVLPEEPKRKKKRKEPELPPIIDPEEALRKVREAQEAEDLDFILFLLDNHHTLH